MILYQLDCQLSCSLKFRFHERQLDGQWLWNEYKLYILTFRRAVGHNDKTFICKANCILSYLTNYVYFGVNKKNGLYMVYADFLFILKNAKRFETITFT